MEREINKKDVQEFLGALWCALNAATENDRIMQVMDLIEKYSENYGNAKWEAYSIAKQNQFTTAIADMKKLLKNLL